MAKEQKTNAERIAERKRVDEFMRQQHMKIAAAREAGKKTTKKRTYPPAINFLGQGFRNLYDVLSGRKVNW